MDLLSLARKWNSLRLLILALAVSAAAITLWHLSTRRPPVPERTLRIGFESNPPVQIRNENGFSGLAVETVNEAAKRAGVKLEWVETGTSSEQAFKKGLVDLWPLMVNLPDRQKYIHFPRSWMHSSYVLLVRAGSPNPDHRFKGSIAVFKVPLHVRLAREQFPEAHIVEVPDDEAIMKQVCKGADAGFLEARVAAPLLRELPECPSMTLRVHTIPDLKFDAGLASTFESAGAADRIQGEIDNMFRDGMLAGLIAKYSYFGLDDTWASYEQMDNEKKWRWLTWAIGGLVFALSLVLWQATSLRQQKRAETALRESEERFRNMADTAPVMIWVAGPDKLCTYFNKCCLDFTGRSMEQKIGDGWITGIHPEDRAGFLATYSSSFDAREPFQTAFRLRRADGEYRWTLTTGVPRFALGGTFSGYIGSCIDVTDLRNTQEQALARQKLESLGVLAGGIAHDFNNLLGGILAEAELVEAELAAGLSPNEEVQRIKTATIRGSEIVHELMIYAGENQQNLNETVDVSRLVEEMMELLKVSISKHVTLKTNFNRDLPNVWGNAPQIRQVMMNLVLNASEAIGDKEGVIAVTAEQAKGSQDLAPNNATAVTPGDYVRIEVSDTGCGMTDETKAKIFDPFFSSKFPGRGLGLAVVQGIVRDFGGAINIVSAPGQGTVFQVFLPSAPKGASEIRSIITFGELETSNAGNGTILMVEDEETLRQAVSKGLRKRGFSVIEAGDGTVALDLIHAHKDEIDVVLLDVTLPGASSREVLEEALRLGPDLKVIVTSAYDEKRVAAYYSGLRVSHFIRKPFPFGDLVRLLETALPAKRALIAGL